MTLFDSYTFARSKKNVLKLTSAAVLQFRGAQGRGKAKRIAQNIIYNYVVKKHLVSELGMGWCRRGDSNPYVANPH